jgi:SGNH hydrolase-like domain, acetyltransferase AlgX
MVATPARRRRVVRLAGWVALAACLAGFFAAGMFYGRILERQTNDQASTLAAQEKSAPVPSFPPTFSWTPAEYASTDSPDVKEARGAAIRRTAAAIHAECQAAAGGDWEKWQSATAPYRAALLEKIDALKRIVPQPSRYPETEYEALEGLDQFPLFEIDARTLLNYLYDPKTLDKFREQRLVVAADRWLRRRGIDLIFVPVPKMTEVYVEEFLNPCPADGIIAPHVRRTLLELLDQDVEVVDGLSLFRPLRKPAPDYLYNTSDTHWAPRAMRIMAKEVADRILRYDFGARARYAFPIVSSSPGPYIVHDGIGGIGSDFGWLALNAGQQQRARAMQTTITDRLRLVSGGIPLDQIHSPVMLIGHSYTKDFREQLIKALNLLINLNVGDGNTTEHFADFLRWPELLKGCRVVVWVTTEQHLTIFKPLPPPIMDALKE